MVMLWLKVAYFLRMGTMYDAFKTRLHNPFGFQGAPLMPIIWVEKAGSQKDIANVVMLMWFWWANAYADNMVMSAFVVFGLRHGDAIGDLGSFCSPLDAASFLSSLRAPIKESHACICRLGSPSRQHDHLLRM